MLKYGTFLVCLLLAKQSFSQNPNPCIDRLQKIIIEKLANRVSNADKNNPLPDPNSNLLPGYWYRIHFKGNSQIEDMLFENSYSKDGLIFYEFAENWGKNKKVITFTSNEIVGIRRALIEETLTDKINDYSLDLAMMSKSISNLMFLPFKTLVKKESIEVVGSLISNKKIGQTVASKMEHFDKKMAKLGFLKPDFTRIIIDDKPLLPNFIGPYNLVFPTFNVWDFKFKKIIAMNPYFWNTEGVKSNTILYHERMHSMLHRTYNEEAFVNRNKAFQEALADFASANFAGTEKIGRNVGTKGQEIRNIKLRTADGQDQALVDSILTVSQYNYHNNSLLISNVLWQIRSQLGSEKTFQILKTVIDNLNQYRESFTTFEKNRNVPQTLDSRQRFIYDFEYFLAVLLKTNENLTGKTMSGLISQVTKEMSLDPEKITSIADALERSTNNFAYDGKGQFVNGLKIAAYGAAGFTVQGYFIYQLASDKEKR